MHYTLSYTSASEGITLGVSGNDWMSCLLAFTEEFGEGVLPLYEKTREEMKQMFLAVAETFPEEVSNAQATIEKQAVGRIADLLREEESEDGDAGKGDRDDADPGTGSSGSSPVCAVCGTGITEDLAEASELMLGEARCSTCTA